MGLKHGRATHNAIVWSGRVLLGRGSRSFRLESTTRGVVALALLIIAASARAIIETGHGIQPSHLSMFLTFLFVSPVAVTYSFRARKNAPDRLLALAAFAGSFVVAVFLVFMLVGIIHSLFLV